MRALVLTAPRLAEVQDVSDPQPRPGEALVAVARVGVCGTDEELFDGSMAYFASGRASYPLRPGHEWTGTVVEVGDGVDPTWRGRRVIGDTMLADGTCDRCRSGRRHVCRNLAEVGISMGVDGALAERLVVPADSLHRLPDAVDDAAGALVEPGGNAWRAASAAWAEPGRRVLVWGSGTIGLLTAAFAHAAGAEVHVVARREAAAALARRLGADATWTPDMIPTDVPFLSIVDATDDASVVGRAVDLVEPGGRVVTIGLAAEATLVDTRTTTLKDVSVVGILSGSPGLEPAIEAYASGAVDPRPLIGAVVGLDQAPVVLAGEVHAGPKVHIDPRR